MSCIRENIQTAVLKYGPNKVRSARKTKIQIFSLMDRTNWSIRALLYSHTQRPKPSLMSELNIFVSSLTAAVGREIFSNSAILFKVKLSLEKRKLNVKVFVVHFVCLLKEAFDFPVQYAFFGGPIRLWTDR